MSLKISVLSLPCMKPGSGQDRYNHDLSWVPVFSNWRMHGYLFTYLASYSQEGPVLSCLFIIPPHVFRLSWCDTTLLMLPSRPDFCFTALSWFTLLLLTVLFQSPLPPLYSLILSCFSLRFPLSPRLDMWFLERAVLCWLISPCNSLWQLDMLISPQLHLQWSPLEAWNRFSPRRLENITNQGFFFIMPQIALVD